MTLRRSLMLAFGLSCLATLWAFQRPFREYPGRENPGLPLPPDWQEKTEWVFARLMYPPASFGFGRRGAFGSYWTQGYSSWTTDYPRCERHFAQALRRLTRIHTRSVEQPVNIDEGDHYDWPFLYAVEVGRWDLTDAQAKGLREYLLRGGFFFVDDFHGSYEWEVFMATMRRVFPDRPVVDLPDKDAIFHLIYDLDDKYQVPGAQFLYSGQTWERDGFKAQWRGIYDDHGRLMVVICANMDLGDAWEHADNPNYPQPYSALAIRIGVNYIVYGMTH
jgi:uncharacterized protein DUF4159